MGNRGDRCDVEDVDLRIADGFGIEQPGLFRDRLFEILRIVGVDEVGLDAKLAQVDVEQRVGSAVKRARRHDLIALLQQRQHRDHLGGLAGRERQPGAPAFERRHALLEHRGGRIGNPRVDVAERLQVEQARSMISAVEHVRGRLVDRHRARAGRRIGQLPGVQAQRFYSEFSIRHG